MGFRLESVTCGKNYSDRDNGVLSIIMRVQPTEKLNFYGINNAEGKWKDGRFLFMSSPSILWIVGPEAE